MASSALQQMFSLIILWVDVSQEMISSTNIMCHTLVWCCALVPPTFHVSCWSLVLIGKHKHIPACMTHTNATHMHINQGKLFCFIEPKRTYVWNCICTPLWCHMCVPVTLLLLSRWWLWRWDQRWYLQLKLKPLVGGVHLWSGVIPPIAGGHLKSPSASWRFFCIIWDDHSTGLN